MVIDRNTLRMMHEGLAPETRARVDEAAGLIVSAKERGGKVAAVLGSGPNLHEGVTCLVAELMHKGIIDGVSTSSAVINHEMGGTLEKVKRVNGVEAGIDPERLPADRMMEVSMMPGRRLALFARESLLDLKLYKRLIELEGSVIVKVAGNMAYPSGLRTERLAREALALAKRAGVPFERIVGCGADRYTMIGAGASTGKPVLVTVPQLVGGGEVGLAVGDSITISERCQRVARLLSDADVIIESAVALSQEIHDGPFERFTGHGIWADWEGAWTYSLAEKTLIRIDLDPSLEKAWAAERTSGMVSGAVDRGLPKTKVMGAPFRMEMSGFARLPGSLPIVGDIGEIWPLLAVRAAERLGVRLDFISYKQSLPAGVRMREWIVRRVEPVDREGMYAGVRAMMDLPFIN